MKKNHLQIILVCSLFLTTQTGLLLSQERAPYVYVGVHKSSITSSDPETSWKDPIGFQAGAGIPFLFFGDALSIRAEINGSLQGARWEEDAFKGRTDLWYINLPLTIRYRFTMGLFGEVGIQPGYLLTAKDKYEGHTESYTEFLNRFDIGIPIGIGYELSKNLAVGLRVVPGLMNLDKDSGEKDHNLIFGIRVIYTFIK
jgi:Outer membrane protein beta-barrel domain